eukprot:scaffold42284_cov49-Prasinocladus_malaysianus.AAC.4
MPLPPLRDLPNAQPCPRRSGRATLARGLLSCATTRMPARRRWRLTWPALLLTWLRQQISQLPDLRLLGMLCVVIVRNVEPSKTPPISAYYGGMSSWHSLTATPSIHLGVYLLLTPLSSLAASR